MTLRAVWMSGSMAVLLACGTGDYDLEQGAAPGTADELSSGVTWTQFLSQTYQEPESGIFIVDGDVPVTDVKRLREFYERYVQSGQLIIHRSGGADVKWSDTNKLNLSYCVSTTFGTRYNTVVQAMTDATTAWEAAGNVNFVHLSAQDSNCTASNTNVVFDVRPVNANGQYLARAFFPDASRKNRNVLIENSAFTSSGNPTLTGILRHELGHALGFRHEHTRPEAKTCFEDTNWRQLTSYDPESVMHYPQCNGTGDWSLTLTSLDKQGTAGLYGAPGSGTGGEEPPPPPSGGDTGTVQTQTVSGSVAQGAWKHYGPIAVLPGTDFTVKMTGSGDPDLYVRFGSAPTTTAYDCRPYVDGATESCALTVPAGTSEAYVSVRGYTSGSFTLTVGWTAPAAGGGTGTGSGTPTTQKYSGSVAQGQNVHHGPLAVMAGTTFKVVMTGSGDPDLYVRFGAQPTTSSYHCRPYLNGASETCTLQVPTGASSAYIMVRGYQSATYTLDVSYTTP